jgi:hypothetical protein
MEKTDRIGNQKQIIEACWAEVVGSNPTRSTFIYEATTALFWIQFWQLSDKKPLLAKLINLVVDNKFSLTVELKDGTRERMRRNEEGIGLTTYSNSESTLSSYASIFETHSVDTKWEIIIVLDVQETKSSFVFFYLQYCKLLVLQKDTQRGVSPSYCGDGMSFSVS